MIEKEAINNAKAFGQQTETLKILHIPDLQDSLGSYKVDVEKKALVKISEPRRANK